MGNVLSEEADDPSFLEQGFNLESPEADKKINYGTAAPNWQNKKEESDDDDEAVERGQEVAMPPSSSSSSNDQPTGSHNNNSNGTNNNNNNSNGSTSNNNGPLSAKHRRDSNVSDSSADERRKRQHKEQLQQQQQQQQQQLQQKKLSYIQMAKLGYQELVNAIIRPPRAEYKVRKKIVWPGLASPCLALCLQRLCVMSDCSRSCFPVCLDGSPRPTRL